jgi:cytochrome c-type biogenesis protein CcmH
MREIKTMGYAMSMSRVVLLLVLAALHSIGNAADTPFEFEKYQHEKLYKELVIELRCLVCQNQSLSDSHAPLAQDLRNEVYKMVNAGVAKQEIIDFLVERYGDFVLYKPSLKKSTFLLWFGPFILLVVALGVAAVMIKNRVGPEVEELSSEQADKIKSLLQDDVKGADE